MEGFGGQEEELFVAGGVMHEGGPRRRLGKLTSATDALLLQKSETLE